MIYNVVLISTVGSLLAGTMEGAEEKKKFSAVPETLKKKRNFTELKIKRLRKKFAQKMLRKQGGSLSMKKLSFLLAFRSIF